MIIPIEKVRDYKEIYVVTFYDGYIDGSKYDVTSLNTTYTGFYATYGTQYFDNFEEADTLAQKLNKGN